MLDIIAYIGAKTACIFKLENSIINRHHTPLILVSPLAFLFLKIFFLKIFFLQTLPSKNYFALAIHFLPATIWEVNKYEVRLAELL